MGDSIFRVKVEFGLQYRCGKNIQFILISDCFYSFNEGLSSMKNQGKQYLASVPGSNYQLKEQLWL